MICHFCSLAWWQHCSVTATTVKQWHNGVRASVSCWSACLAGGGISARREPSPAGCFLNSRLRLWKPSCPTGFELLCIPTPIHQVEHRSIHVSSEMNAYLHANWPHIRQVAQVTRVITSKKGTTTEIVYLITNLSSAQASPSRLLTLVRGHWSIENGSHYVRDVTDCGKIALVCVPGTLLKFWPLCAILPLP
jgi:hypothetical protein